MKISRKISDVNCRETRITLIVGLIYLCHTDRLRWNFIKASLKSLCLSAFHVASKYYLNVLSLMLVFPLGKHGSRVWKRQDDSWVNNGSQDRRETNILPVTIRHLDLLEKNAWKTRIRFGFIFWGANSLISYSKLIVSSVRQGFIGMTVES